MYSVVETGAPNYLICKYLAKKERKKVSGIKRENFQISS